MTDVEKLIQQRIELFDTEVALLFEMKDEELANITITPGQFKAYVDAIGQKTVQLDNELKEHILGNHSHYCGRIEGMQMILKLFALMRAPKIPYIFVVNIYTTQHLILVINVVIVVASTFMKMLNSVLNAV